METWNMEHVEQRLQLQLQLQGYTVPDLYGT